MSEVEKPRRKPGLMCPLHKRDVSKVCHQCELYIAIGLVDPATGGTVQDWGCALKQAVRITHDLGFVMTGVQQAVESFRNAALDGRPSRLAASGDRGGPRINGARILADEPAKMIEG